jgi:hypothetical protein
MQGAIHYYAQVGDYVKFLYDGNNNDNNKERSLCEIRNLIEVT